MSQQPFSLSSRNEVCEFEKLFDQYLTQRSAFALRHISLTKAFEQLQCRTDGGRVFTALFDIQINFSMLWLDTVSAGSAWASFAHAGIPHEGTILDSIAKFSGKMDIHRFNSSFVLRYRSLWDKVMGLLILIMNPANYERFHSAGSKKTAFKKFAVEFWPAESVQQLLDVLQRFDDSFRTAEAHGTGILRKYSFTMDTLDKTPHIQLIGYWNLLNAVVSEVGKVIDAGPDASAWPLKLQMPA
jgi:hypothetical protein